MPTPSYDRELTPHLDWFYEMSGSPRSMTPEFIAAASNAPRAVPVMPDVLTEHGAEERLIPGPHPTRPSR